MLDPGLLSLISRGSLLAIGLGGAPRLLRVRGGSTFGDGGGGGTSTSSSTSSNGEGGGGGIDFGTGGGGQGGSAPLEAEVFAHSASTLYLPSAPSGLSFYGAGSTTAAPLEEPE